MTHLISGHATDSYPEPHGSSPDLQNHSEFHFNPLNAELNLICHLLALLGAHHIFHVSGVRVNIILPFTFVVHEGFSYQVLQRKCTTYLSFFLNCVSGLSHASHFYQRISGRSYELWLYFLDAFAKLQQSAISCVMCVRPSVRMEQFGSHWADFHEIWHFRIFRKTVEKKI